MSASQRPLLRLVLAVSLDGRLAPAEGGAAQIGGRGDRRVLEEALAWADAALLGAETLRRHGSTCLIHAPDLLEQRAREGRSPQPMALVASRSGAVPAQLPFFQQPLQRWLLQFGPPLPCPEGFVRRLCCSGWSEALAELASAGIGRLLVLGGASLATSLLQETLLDELQLTLCPRLLGGAHTWLGDVLLSPQASQGWRLLELRQLEDEELMLRYGRDPGLA